MMDPFSLQYSDDNKKNTSNGGYNGHGLRNVRCKQTFAVYGSEYKLNRYAWLIVLRGI